MFGNPLDKIKPESSLKPINCKQQAKHLLLIEHFRSDIDFPSASSWCWLLFHSPNYFSDINPFTVNRIDKYVDYKPNGLHEKLFVALDPFQRYRISQCHCNPT